MGEACGIRVRTVIVGLASFLALVTSLAAAPEILGPTTYTLIPGAPQKFTLSFAADVEFCDRRSVFVMSMQNAGVASGVVSINGVPVFSENDFQLNSPVLERAVPLLGTNALSVSLNGGKQGGSITLTVRRDIEPVIDQPMTYQLAGPKDTFSSDFTLADLSGPFHLLLSTGDASGLHRVTSALVTVNGTAVAGPNEIDSPIGLVRVPVYLVARNEVRVELKGKAGDFVTLKFVRLRDESVCGPKIVISNPPAGSTISAGTFVVGGTVTGATDVGVAVNGVPADVLLGANGTDADPLFWTATLEGSAGELAVSAVATTSSGAHAADERSFVLNPPEQEVRMVASPRSGAVPLDVMFRILPGDDVAQLQIDFDGDGIFDYTGPVPSEAPRHIYATPGIRLATLRVTRTDGSVLSTIAPVTAQSVLAIDSLLKKQWASFADALGAGDVEAAMRYIIDDAARNRYQPLLELIRPRLAAFAAGIRDVHMVYVKGGLADYLVIRTEDGQAHGYHVYFMPASDGIWRIVQF